MLKNLKLSLLFAACTFVSPILSSQAIAQLTWDDLAQQNYSDDTPPLWDISSHIKSELDMGFGGYCLFGQNENTTLIVQHGLTEEDHFGELRLFPHILLSGTLEIEGVILEFDDLPLGFTKVANRTLQTYGWESGDPGYVSTSKLEKLEELGVVWSAEETALILYGVAHDTPDDYGYGDWFNFYDSERAVYENPTGGTTWSDIVSFKIDIDVLGDTVEKGMYRVFPLGTSKSEACY